MTKDLPDVLGHEKNTLYIIGNGFDLAHGILSKYKHFCCWLNLNGYEKYADTLQKMFPKLYNRIDDIWCNFESALEHLDLHYSFKQYVSYPNDGWNDNEWDKNINIGNKAVKEIIDNIPILLKKWAKQINVGVKPIFHNLSTESKYLTFNYTLTLEEIYHIPTENICHIHESVKSDSKLIVGFDNPKSTNNLPAESDEEERAQSMFVESQNSLVKPKQQQIEKNSVFYSSLHDIDRIIVIGHSMAFVDLKYFAEVNRSVKQNAKWYFSHYCYDDVNRVMLFVKPARYQPNRINNYELFDLN